MGVGCSNNNDYSPYNRQLLESNQNKSEKRSRIFQSSNRDDIYSSRNKSNGADVLSDEPFYSDNVIAVNDLQTFLSANVLSPELPAKTFASDVRTPVSTSQYFEFDEAEKKPSADKNHVAAARSSEKSLSFTISETGVKRPLMEDQDFKALVKMMPPDFTIEYLQQVIEGKEPQKPVTPPVKQPPLHQPFPSHPAASMVYPQMQTSIDQHGYNAFSQNQRDVADPSRANLVGPQNILPYGMDAQGRMTQIQFIPQYFPIIVPREYMYPSIPQQGASLSSENDRPDQVRQSQMLPRGAMMPPIGQQFVLHHQNIPPLPASPQQWQQLPQLSTDQAPMMYSPQQPRVQQYPPKLPPQHPPQRRKTNKKE